MALKDGLLHLKAFQPLVFTRSVAAVTLQAFPFSTAAGCTAEALGKAMRLDTGGSATRGEVRGFLRQALRSGAHLKAIQLADVLK